VALICDTGPLYAAIDRNDDAHEACARLIEEADERIVVPAPVVVELDWLIGSRLSPDALDAFLEEIERGGVHVEELKPEDYARARVLCRRYQSLPLGFVDAAVIAVVERLGERKVATLDLKHFRVVRPAHARALRLLPES
jgi:predicted nucleic acid-binding protein